MPSIGSQWLAHWQGTNASTLERSSLILMHGKQFRLGTTVQYIDALMSRLLSWSTFPQLHSAAYGLILTEHADQHGSTEAFVQHLKYLVHKRMFTFPLAFLMPLDPLERDEDDLRSLAMSLSDGHLQALRALPSLRTEGAQTMGDAELREQLPRWLVELARARHRRAAAINCVVMLLDAVFPGSNRTITSSRLLYAQLLCTRVEQAPAFETALHTLVGHGVMTDDKIRQLLEQCQDLLEAR